MDRGAEKVSAWAQQLVHLRAARRFIEACEAEGIQVLPVKGIVSGRTLYRDVADRPLTDVDVRVRPRDIARIVELARRSSWPIVQRMRAYRNVVVVVEGASIDVEAGVGPPGMCRLSANDMLLRATESDALGFKTRWPRFVDHAVLLVVNVFKDKLTRAFEWSARDLERLPTHPSFDARELARALAAAGCATQGHVVADWMARRGKPGWDTVRDQLGHPRPGYVRAFSWLRRHAPADALSLRVLARLAPDRPADRVLALAAMGLWQIEAIASQQGETPYVRGHVPPWDPGERDGPA